MKIFQINLFISVFFVNIGLKLIVFYCLLLLQSLKLVMRSHNIVFFEKTDFISTTNLLKNEQL